MIAAVALVARAPAKAAEVCDRSATVSSFASELAAASAGQTICLASGSYGTFAGTGKAVTIRAAEGASVQMRVSLGSGDSGFTLEGLSGMGGMIANGATNITIRNSAFTSPIDIGGAGTDAIVLEANTHNWSVGPSSGADNAKIYLENSLTGTLAAPSVTIKDSEIANGDLDGIHFGGGSGYQILGNRLVNLCDMGANHTDNMQFDTSTTTQVRIAGNYVFAPQSCGTQGITSYDAGTSGVIIEDNVVDIRRPWGIELYADRNSIVRHNTVRWYPDSGCDFGGIDCGQIDINRKSANPAGSGTQVYDNLATRVNFSNGSMGEAHHNVSGRDAVYVGPDDSYRGFALSSSSPVGVGTASDGLDNGIRAGADPSPTPTPTPTETPTPTPTQTPTPTPTQTPAPDTPADAVWASPTDAVAGSPVTLDGTRSTGDAPITCTWTFEVESGSTLWEPPVNGCTTPKTFQVAGTKYVRLTVTDADGDTDAAKQSFSVLPPSPEETPTPTPTETPTPEPTATPTPEPTATPTPEPTATPTPEPTATPTPEPTATPTPEPTATPTPEPTATPTPEPTATPTPEPTATPTPEPTATPTPEPTATPTPEPTATPTPEPDAPAVAAWTAPSDARVGTAVTLDGTSSTGDGPISCTWTFENESGSTLWEPPVDGCTLEKTFQVAGTKHIRLTVTDADGDTGAAKQSFVVGATSGGVTMNSRTASEPWFGFRAASSTLAAACVVPRVKLHRAATARRLLRSAGCRHRIVRIRSSRPPGRVLSTRPRAGRRTTRVVVVRVSSKRDRRDP